MVLMTKRRVSRFESQNWKDELTILCQRLAALESPTKDSSVGMASSHNPTVFAPLYLLLG